MPPKRKTPLSESAPSSKRVRIASPTSQTRPPPRDSEIEDTIAVSDTPAKRGPGRPRKNPGAPVTPRPVSRRAPKKTAPTPTPRKGRSTHQQHQLHQQLQSEIDVASEDGEGSPDDSELPVLDMVVGKDSGTLSPSATFSSDELATASAQAQANPTPRRRAIRKPRITYKSRRSSLLSRDEAASSGSEADPISITKSSPIMSSKRSVPAPSTPATTIKPRGRPPRPRKSAPEMPAGINIAPVAVMEVTPSAGMKTRGGRLSYGSLHETDAEGEDDDMLDEDVVVGDGRIEIVTTTVVPVVTTPSSTYKVRANRRRSLPTPAKKSVQLDGIVDPFALPEGESIEVNGGTTVEVAKIQQFPQKALKALKKRIMGKLTGRKPCKLVGVAEEEMHMRKLLEQTVVAGEGNSMLIIGARGSGKTTLFETAISDLREEHGSEFLVVRLNGFLQTDDKIALKEIWRQLGVEMELDEKDQPKTNFADTLSSILAILSHPDELKAPDEDQGIPNNNTTALSVIFLLEEFDLFAGHPRQTLLYNLFDIAQSRKAPIAVIGTTTRIDVTEALEKRVKSRFSHRTVHLRNPATLGSFWAVCKEGLGIDMDELDADITVSDEERETCEAWNTHIESLYKNDKSFQRVLKRVFAQSKDVKAFFNACVLPVAGLPSSGVFPSGADFTAAATSLSEPDSILSILEGLTDLGLTLLIAAARLDIVSDTDTCNFSMAYDEYVTLTSSLKVQNSVGGVTAGRLWGKEVALGAWERLGEYGVLTPAVLGVAGQGRQGGMGREGRMWRVEVGLGEVGACLERGSAGQGRGGLGKWCREV